MATRKTLHIYYGVKLSNYIPYRKHRIFTRRTAASSVYLVFYSLNRTSHKYNKTGLPTLKSKAINIYDHCTLVI